MNQTKKRLAIIKLAISMTDTETIQLQVLKLGMLETDSKMKEILAMLNEQNYAQAQRLISSYIETPQKITVVQQRTPQDVKPTSTLEKISITHKEKPPSIEAMIEIKEEPQIQEQDILTLKEKIQQAKDQAIIDQFELFTQSEDEEEYKQTDNYDALLNTVPKAKKMSIENVNYDALLQIEAKDILPDNIELNISQVKEAIPISKVNDSYTEKNEPMREVVKEDLEDIREYTETQETSIIEKGVIEYHTISYIDQKLEKMLKHYPPIEQSDESFSSSDIWLQKISQDGYNEKEIVEIVKRIEELSSNHKAEAAQLMLIIGATESKYARFRLARALFKGNILQKNPNEAVKLINDLAIKDQYPEAICDLAQFYENGLGVKKDTKKAEALYKEAMELGIRRAIDNYERIQKINRGFFSSFKK